MLGSRSRTDISEIPVLRKAGGQRVEGSGKRPHRRGEDSRDHQPAHARRHFMQDVICEGMGHLLFLIKRPEQNADCEKTEDDGEIGQTGKDQRQAALGGIFGRQHPLHHVLVGAVRGHCDEGGAEEGSPEGVFRPQNLADIFQKGGIRLGTRIEKNHVFGSVE